MSWGVIYNNTQTSISALSDALARLQEQASTGARIIRASDGPNDAYRILHLKQTSLNLANYTKNLDSVDANLEGASSALQQMSNSLIRVRELLTQAASQTYVGSNRTAMAEEINSLLEEIVSVANYQNLGRYVFGGSAVTAAPYVADRTDGRITAVRYQGSHDDLPVPVAPGVQCSGMLVGDEVFRNNDRHSPVFLGDTGAAAGTGTSTVRGDVWLTAVHSATAYDDGGAGSGVAAGAGSPNGDTILGVHTLTIDAGARTVRLDSGPAVTFTDEANLKVTSGAGDMAYVDMSHYNGTFNGNITLTGTGTLSIDDGASTTALTAGSFSDPNVKVTDSRTGRILYVNAVGIARTGVEPIRVPGTYDLFGTVIEVRDLMRNTRDLSDNEQSVRLTAAVDSLTEVMSAVQNQLTAVGGRQGALASLRTSMDDMKTNADTEGAKIENADVVQIAMDLARTQTLYQMSLSIAGKLLSTSLLDFINPAGA